MRNSGQSQNTLPFKKILKLQEKAIQTINLKTPNAPVGPLLKDNKILKISDFINYKNAMLVRSILRKENLAKFNEMFLTLNQNHNYNTRAATNHLLDTPKILTVHYGENSVRSKASDSWNYLCRTIETLDLLNCDFSQFKKTVFQTNFDKYNL